MIIVPTINKPFVFMISAFSSAYIYTLSHPIGVVLFALTIVYFFPMKVYLPMLGIMLFFLVFITNSAFILDKDYNHNSSILYTTKGYQKIKNSENEVPCNIGNLIIGVNANRNKTILPRPYYKLKDDFSCISVPIITKMLQKRVNDANLMFYASGGVVNTTQAHIFGVRKFIGSELSDMFIITGLAHLLSISGFHVVMFTGGIFALLFFLPLKIRFIVTIPLLTILIPMSGFQVTVIRAVFFSIGFMLGIIFDLKIKSVKYLFFLAGMIAIFLPYTIFTISFILSFGAVFGILTVFNTQKGFFVGAILVGLAATVFTLPVQLYFFGTSNIASVLTTVITGTLVSVQMLLGALAFCASFLSDSLFNLFIPPLQVVEKMMLALMKFFTKYSMYTLYIARPAGIILILMGFFGLFLAMTKYRALCLITLLVPLLPIYPDNIIIFPSMAPSQKGYIAVKDGKSEIFFQGQHASFLRYMVPAAAKFGIKNFDYGSIRIFNGKNMYLNIKNEKNIGDDGIVCINTDEGTCLYAFYTRSNSLKKTVKQDKNYYIYKNIYTADNIIQLEGKEFIQKLE